VITPLRDRSLRDIVRDASTHLRSTFASHLSLIPPTKEGLRVEHYVEVMVERLAETLEKYLSSPAIDQEMHNKIDNIIARQERLEARLEEFAAATKGRPAMSFTWPNWRSKKSI